MYFALTFLSLLTAVKDSSSSYSKVKNRKTSQVHSNVSVLKQVPVHKKESINWSASVFRKKTTMS